MRVTRTDWLDWYVDGDESAVFVGDQVIVLSVLATALAGLVGDGVGEAAALAARLVEMYGEPEAGAAEEATRAAIDDLVAAGVLAVETTA